MSTLSCLGALSQGSSDGTLGNAGGVNTKEPYINGGGAPEPWAEARWCVMGGRGWQAERSSCADKFSHTLKFYGLEVQHVNGSGGGWGMIQPLIVK